MDPLENKQLIRHLYNELNKGNTGPFIECMAADIRWTVIGTTKFSGTITGKQDVIDKLFARVASELDGSTMATMKNILAEGDYVVVESSSQVTTREGKPYNNTYCEIFRLDGGKVKEVTVYLDTALVNAVFGAEVADD